MSLSAGGVEFEEFISPEVSTVFERYTFAWQRFALFLEQLAAHPSTEHRPLAEETLVQLQTFFDQYPGQSGVKRVIEAALPESEMAPSTRQAVVVVTKAVLHALAEDPQWQPSENLTILPDVRHFMTQLVALSEQYQSFQGRKLDQELDHLATTGNR